MYSLEITILTSLKIFFVYSSYKPGMIFFPIWRLIDKGLSLLPERVNLYLRKPAGECVICMASFYGILFSLNIFEVSIQYLLFLFQVAGLNYIISAPLHFFHDQGQKDIVYHKQLEIKEDNATKN